MKRAVIYILAITTLASCSKEKASGHDFIDKVIDLTIDTSTGEYVQLPDLYDFLANTIPEDQNEKIILVERLKMKGFKITSWGRGNIPPLGPRIVTVELMNEHCSCEVTKTYYATTVDTLYQMTEGIKCRSVALGKVQ